MRKQTHACARMNARTHTHILHYDLECLRGLSGSVISNRHIPHGRKSLSSYIIIIIIMAETAVFYVAGNLK